VNVDIKELLAMIGERDVIIEHLRRAVAELQQQIDKPSPPEPRHDV
jgi:hypothetical protein